MARPDIFEVLAPRNSTGEIVQLSPGETGIHIIPNDWTIPSQSSTAWRRVSRASWPGAFLRGGRASRADPTNPAPRR